MKQVRGGDTQLVVQVGKKYVRARKTQTDQTTTLCVQEVEIYLERWEVLGALVDVGVGQEKSYLFFSPILH